jgi:Zn-dependent protease
MQQFDQDWLFNTLLTLIPLWLSLSFHECAHAWTAWKLGDDTAARLGRLTLNPLAHIDPVGTLLLPLLGIPFGWAKPVPVQPQRFREGVRMRTGMMLVAIAGPISNLLLAAVCILGFATLARFCPTAIAPGGVRQGWTGIGHVLEMLIFMNVLLATFNALPIPPLDGSRVADALMPRPLRPVWKVVCRLGPMALIAVILLPRLVRFDLFYWPMQGTLFLLCEAVKLFYLF